MSAQSVLVLDIVELRARFRQLRPAGDDAGVSCGKGDAVSETGEGGGMAIEAESSSTAPRS